MFYCLFDFPNFIMGISGIKFHKDTVLLFYYYLLMCSTNLVTFQESLRSYNKPLQDLWTKLTLWYSNFLLHAAQNKNKIKYIVLDSKTLKYITLGEIGILGTINIHILYKLWRYLISFIAIEKWAFSLKSDTY